MLTKQLRELERQAQVQEQFSMKTKLEVLIKLPKHHFDAVIKIMNPKVEDKDLKPMFPEHWSDDCNQPESKYNYDSFRTTQIQIDEWYEKLAGC